MKNQVSPPVFTIADRKSTRLNSSHTVIYTLSLHDALPISAVLQHHGLGVALEREAEGVVGGDEEPGVAARLHDRVAGAVGEHPGVVGPMHGIRRARLAGEIRGGRARDEERLALLAG